MKHFVEVLLMTISFAVVTILIGITFKDYTFDTIPFSEIIYSTLMFFLACMVTFLISTVYKKVKSRKNPK
ncbi:hypothetical protein [Enterococcus casseliflavus]|uniref:hypothetical protein n=1 Tax=Enterococcus casseliflavus TaxID=37734 RepID=UPI00177AC469|nr:hypothetical protein [Enterococcus casseliflavus]QOG31616.1 hypothetical protein EGM182_12715 [Enterococcus casseliflavus]